MPTIYQIVMTALFAAFIILVITKNGFRYTIRDLCDKFNFSIFAKMIDCDLCFSFWLSLFICLILAYLLYDISFLIVPIFSTPITRFLL